MSDPMRLSLMNDPAHWQKRAHEARASAELLADNEAKRTMLGIADGYDRIAARALERIITSTKV